MQSYTALCNFYRKISSLKNVLGILRWDSSCVMPLGANKSRGEDVALLTSLRQKLLSSNQLGDILASIDIKRLNDWQTANVREIKLQRSNALAVEPRLAELAARTSIETEVVWREAKANNSFEDFLPHLKKTVSIARDVAKSRATYFNCKPYDALLDIYDPGRKTEEINEICNDLRKFLPSFIKKITLKQRKEKVFDLGDNIFPKMAQKTLGKYCMDKLGFDFGCGRLDTSSHPFCGGNSRDVRITTRYNENDFLSGLMGVMHETGHAMYEQNLPESYKDQALGEARSTAIHESQSLLIERQIGNSMEFLQFIAPKLEETFNVSGQKWCNAKNLYAMLNKVQPSLIRIESDEVTYLAHIILRFEIEKEIILGNFNLNDLPNVWAEGMKELLGVTPDSDRNGCLQDIHWSLGAFGYFPSYMLGAMMSVQFFNAAKKSLPKLPADIEKGNFAPLLNWLRKNIWSQGSFYKTKDLLHKVTGRASIDTEGYKEYLKEKYL